MPDWLQDTLADTTALQLIFWVIAVGGLIGLLIKFWPLFRNSVAVINSVLALAEFMVETTATLERQDEALISQDAKIKEIYVGQEVQKTKIEEIHHETHANNGSSLKDGMKRVELSGRRIERRVKNVEVRLDTLAPAVEDSPRSSHN